MSEPHPKPAAALPWTPIMRQLIESSVWESDPIVRVLWVTMLIIGSEPGRRGRVDMTLGSLAGRARLSEEQTRAALETLASPDPESRNQTNEGRRVALLDVTRNWGWQILNWEVYEAARASAANAARQARFRATTKRVKKQGRYAPLRNNPEKENEKEKEREGKTGSLSPRPSVEEARKLWADEGLRGSPERFVHWHDARGWDGVSNWQAAARLWSERERETTTDPLSDWGKNRPPEADEEFGRPQDADSCA